MEPSGSRVMIQRPHTRRLVSILAGLDALGEAADQANFEFPPRSVEGRRVPSSSHLAAISASAEIAKRGERSSDSKRSPSV